MRLGELLLPFGRVGRRAFCLSYLIYGSAISASVHALTQEHQRMKTAGITEPNWSSLDIALPATALLVALWLVMVITVKRLHDLDMSGFQLVALTGFAFLPNWLARWVGANDSTHTILAIATGVVLGLMTLFVLGKCAITRGDDGPNRFGPDPRAM